MRFSLDHARCIHTIPLYMIYANGLHAVRLYSVYVFIAIRVVSSLFSHLFGRNIRSHPAEAFAVGCCCCCFEASSGQIIDI